jgi:type IV secretory pathway component VirB8
MITSFGYGFYVGFFAVLFSVALFIAIISIVEVRKKKEFLVEINSLQEYEVWKRGGK